MLSYYYHIIIILLCYIIYIDDTVRKWQTGLGWVAVLSTLATNDSPRELIGQGCQAVGTMGLYSEESHGLGSQRVPKHLKNMVPKLDKKYMPCKKTNVDRNDRMFKMGTRTSVL